jgi:RHS repeat-associated protein
VLNGTALVGNPTNQWPGYITFAGSQTLSGDGTVVFGLNGYNVLWLDYAGTTLTIGSGITVRGQNGGIGAWTGYPLEGPANVSVINQGTISADVAGGQITINAQPFSNQGNVAVSAGATLSVNAEAAFNDPSALLMQAGGTLQVDGNLLGNTRNVDQWLPQGILSFTSGAHEMEAMSLDLGNVPNGYVDNFAYGTISLASGAQVTFVDQFTNSAEPPPECVYTTSLIVPSGSTLNLNGLHLYARLTQIGGTVTGGAVSQTPDIGGPLMLGNSAPGTISAAGAFEEFTFLGRSGEHVAISVDTGSASVLPPPLTYAFVQLFDPSMNLLAQASNSVPQQIVGLLNVILPVDGTYTVAVRAPATQSASTGNYLVTLWDATPNVASLVVNQQEYGQITTPFSVDEWNFSAPADEQVQFNLINAAAPGIAFDLSGPNGWVGFSNLVTSSGLVTLPYGGNYTLTAFGTRGAYGFAYTFELVQTAETNLPVGATFSGSFVGNGQAQLIAVNLTNGSPLLITLNNGGANNVTELYAQLGSPPTRGAFGYESISPNSPNQQILIPNANAGTYYVLIYGNQISTPGSYSVQVLAANVFLTRVAPNLGPNNTALTLTLNGVGFLPSTGVQLISTNGASFPATSATADSFTQMTATFASNTLPAGVYSVQVSGADGSSATLTNSFVVSSQGAANFASSLSLPSAVRIPRIPATIYPQYVNTGDAPMPAPLLVLTATAQENGQQDALLTLDSTLLARGIYSSAQPAGFSSTAQFLASGQIPGFLEPGELFQIPVYWAGWLTPLTPHTYLNWNLGVIQANDPTPVDWASLEYSLEPPTIPADAWNAIFMAFTNQVGSTWGSYVTMLDNNSAYLGRLGLNVTDISKLLAFQFMQDDGLCPLRTLASSVDAFVPAPGLPLTFSRSFGERISQRYASGPLGRGWSHNWQYSLQVGSDGTVTIFGPGGSQRVFQPDSRGIDYFAQPGDYGTLTLAIDAMPPFRRFYTLTEKSGLSFAYGAGGNLQYVQDPNQNRISLGYTGGLLTSLTHSSGQNIQLAYNAAGLIQTITDQLGHQTVLTYDAANQHLVGAQYYDGRSASYAYDTTGPATVLHALLSLRSSGVSRDFSYDPLGRLALVSMGVEPGPGGNGIPIDPITFSYGVVGQVTVTDTLGNPTQFFYDNRGLLAKTVDALGNAVQLSFDNNYNLVSVTDPTGRSYNYGYDSSGNVIQSIDPLGDISQFTYTSTYNRLASVTDAKGNATEYGYTADANLQSINYADGSIESWTYDSYGNPQTWTNRRGHQTIYTNNNYGQITAKQFADGSLTSYAYDPQDNLTSAATFNTNQSPLEVSTMAYDGSNRLVQITYPGGKYLTFAYDSNGRRTSSVDQLGHQLDYSYDGQGRLRSMTNELNALVVQYQYDPDGRVALKTLGNGMFTTYQYDAAGQLLSMTNALASGAVLSIFNYSYDSRGRRTSMNSLDGQWTYAYDDIGQLTHAVFTSATTNIANQDLAYVYDAVGNRTQTIENGVTTSYTANNLNQYVTVGTTNFTFDADGNLIKEVSANGTVTYSYNDENRLISMTSPQGNWQYTYDGLDRRTVITVNGTAMRDVIDPIGLGNVVGEYDSAGNLVAHYDHALGLLSRIDASANWAGYTFDGIGNVQQMVSPAGAILNSYDYQPFGGLLRNVAALPNPFQYVGQYGVMAETSGLNFMRNRFYSPTSGRFQSPDPINVLGGDLNLYRYALNCSPNAIDPSGLDTSSDVLQWIKDQWDYAENLDTTTRPRTDNSQPWDQYFANQQQAAQAMPSEALYTFKAYTDAFMMAPFTAIAGELSGLWGHVLGSIGDLLNDVALFGFNNPQAAAQQQQFPTLSQDLAALAEAVGQSVGSGTTIVGTATDPNGLTGPAGYAVQNYVIESNLFDYEIFFENETNATSPAQIVQITDPLSTNLDWQSFQLAQIAFGNTLISIPPNIQHFQTNMPFSFSGVSFQVQIEAGINLANGQVFANFFSVDPLTGLPPEGEVGFLPPEDGTGRGKGQVSYTVRPTSGLPEGTRIPNVAYIQFDQNPVIATDQVNDNDPSQGIDTNKQAIVTIDNIAPVSSVSGLPAIETNTNFSVCWSGTDVGSGIVSYDIYVSTNSGPWTVWLGGATTPCATFNGQNGNSYGFYSLAHDGAGNVEPRHFAADATTTIQAIIISSPPSLTIVLTGHQVVLAWPTNAGNYVLQTTTNLAFQPNWNTVTNTPSVIGSLDAITLPIINTGQFFRLQSQ